METNEQDVDAQVKDEEGERREMARRQQESDYRAAHETWLAEKREWDLKMEDLTASVFMAKVMTVVSGVAGLMMVFIGHGGAALVGFAGVAYFAYQIGNQNRMFRDHVGNCPKEPRWNGHAS